MSRLEFIHLSDVHYQSEYSDFAKLLIARTGIDFTKHFRRNMAYIAERYQSLDFFLNTGDLVHAGTDEEYAAFARLWDELSGLPFYAVPGNHDKNGVGTQILGLTEPPFDYVRMHGDLQIIGMDARGGKFESGRLSREQLDWLRDVLSNGKDSVLLLHQTPHISGEVEYLVWQMEEPQALYEVVKDANLLGIFCGHTHQNFYSTLGTIPVYTVNSITHGIVATEEDMTLSNRTGFNHCVYENGVLTVEHIEIPADNPVEIVVLYTDFEE